MLKSKKLVSMLLAIITVLSISCVSVFANDTDEIPEGLPDGAYKVYDGIYAVDNYKFPTLTRSWNEGVNLGPVYPQGVISQPAALNAFTISSTDKWICLRSSEYIRVNFATSTTSIFGQSCFDWPKIGTSSSTTYFIETDYYNFVPNVRYQFQCTSANGNTHSNVILDIASSSSKNTFLKTYSQPLLLQK